MRDHNHLKPATQLRLVVFFLIHRSTFSRLAVFTFRLDPLTLTFALYQQPASNRSGMTVTLAFIALARINLLPAALQIEMVYARDERLHL